MYDIREVYIAGKSGKIKAYRSGIRAYVDGNVHDIPINSIDVLIKVGRISMSEDAIRRIVRRATIISLKYYGTIYAYHIPKTSAPSAARVHVKARHKARLSIARLIEYDLLEMMERHAEHHDYSLDLSDIRDKISRARSVDEIEGYESEARSRYHEFYKRIVPEFSGRGKSDRRPPRDKINCLISVANHALYSLALSQIIARGLIPSLGFVHVHTNMALALDLGDVFKPIGYEFVYLHKDEFEPEEIIIGKVSGYYLGREELRKFYRMRKAFLRERSRRAKGVSFIRFIKGYTRIFASSLAEVYRREAPDRLRRRKGPRK